MTNRLASSTSAYLLQHVENPVDWWPWGQEALDEAKQLDRPIFLSVGYAACHWCHVMAHESFENEDIARLLNDWFVPIKVDREERPDVDALYMAATQVLTGHGGWPMSVFLLPDGQPFMAGTYYPPVDRNGQVGFPRLLQAIHEAWENQREGIVTQANELNHAIHREVRFIDNLAPFTKSLDLTDARQKLRVELLEKVDVYGGFGSAPKFPRPTYVEALLESTDPDEKAACTLTLNAMCREGMFDHIAGGFARYSVDAQWHVPHFEKMLSDQALLARCYLRAHANLDATQGWRDVALRTLGYVRDNMRVDGGYASSLDADANGVEGSHIVWTVDQVREALETGHLDSWLPRVLQRWRISNPGEFEGASIPRLATDEPFTTPDDMVPAAAALQMARAERVQPGRDEKVILEWNAMLASAFLMSQDAEFERLGIELLTSLLQTHFKDGHWWRTENLTAYATAADVAWLMDALLDAYALTGNDSWTSAAVDLSHYLLDHFWDGERPTAILPERGEGLFAQNECVTDLGIRTKEIFDGATPSSHAVACRALARLGLSLGNEDLLAPARRLVTLAASLLATHPGAVPDLLDAARYALEGIEVVVPGPPNDLANHVRSLAMSGVVVVCGTGSSPLLLDRQSGLAYVCKQNVCQLPVATIEDLEAQLARTRK